MYISYILRKTGKKLLKIHHCESAIIEVKVQLLSSFTTSKTQLANAGISAALKQRYRCYRVTGCLRYMIVYAR